MITKIQEKKYKKNVVKLRNIIRVNNTALIYTVYMKQKKINNNKYFY